MKVTAVAGALLSLAMLAACGGPDTRPSGTGTVKVAPAPGGSASSSALPSSATLRTYFDGLAKATLTSYDDALAAAEPGSPAAGYVTYLKAAAQALVDSGEKVSESHATAQVKDGGYEFCNGGGSQKTCYQYADITGANGKLVDFSVNGKPVGDRVALGTDTIVSARGIDGKASFVVAFESSAGDNLFVVVRVEAGAHSLSGIRATYRSAQGSESRSARMSGPVKVAPGSKANYAFAFPDARIGGALTLTMHDDGAGGDGIVTMGIS